MIYGQSQTWMAHVIGRRCHGLLLAECISEPGTGTKKLKVQILFPPTPLSIESPSFNASKQELCVLFFFFFNKFPSSILFLSLSSLLFASHQVV